MNNNIDLDEVSVGATAAWITLAGILIVCLVITLGVIKVRNELLMTKAYDRQAVALERIANSLEAHEPPHFLSYDTSIAVPRRVYLRAGRE